MARQLCVSARLKPFASKRYRLTACSMAPKRQADEKQSSPSKKQKESNKASPADLVKALLDEEKLSATYATCTWGLASVHVVCSWPLCAFSQGSPTHSLASELQTAGRLHSQHLTPSVAGTVMSLALTSTLENLKLSFSGAAVSFLFISTCLSSSQPLTKCTD